MSEQQAQFFGCRLPKQAGSRADKPGMVKLYAQSHQMGGVRKKVLLSFAHLIDLPFQQVSGHCPAGPTLRYKGPDPNASSQEQWRSHRVTGFG